ncbi:RsmB/NOP family class I SAM-dependent RNA methyltransferase [Campylobacter sp. LR196d]|uniref:RsmB/NOP family class I SAM-dependent RNA methyltransferase n=1 Tax=Campylobacter sp. LR196d TaxID=2593543 RepID=UPI0012397829|nr:RsmB/NOP family class I SAM-dependent RNA methyltransferase [Campylobacter sp. LR196d]KAA6227038.1 RsmB/NOP family class I SAM-dependent RNA methyltransferase [Campylobacter sp. LR196d]
MILESLYNKDEFDIIEQSFKNKKNVCIFINLLKTTSNLLENAFLKLNLKFQKINDFCYVFKPNDKIILSKMDEFNKGYFYIQNFASYLCAKNLNVKSGESVLDLCAAPGGKSVNLANFMQNQGYLACVEKNKERFFTLKETIKKYNINAKCFLKNSINIGKLCPLKFDKILVDAPCSTMAKTGFKNINKKEIKNLSLTQKKLLHSALNALKIGGELVYSTCTFLKEENEEVIENALNSEFKLLILDLDLENIKAKNGISDIKELHKTKRILPNEYCDGFFIARLKKI